MKKVKKYLFLFILLLGSMYYTNISITKMQENDSIMKEIKKTKEKYEVTPVNAIIEKNSVVPGINGIKIDYEKSYHNMKKYGVYNESLTVLKEISPDISLKDVYEYPISKGNPSKRQISLLIKLEENSPSRVFEILKKKEIPVTIFLDGNDIEKYSSYIKKNPKHEYEILSFQKKYNSSLLKTSRAFLENISKNKTNFCYMEDEIEELKKHCIKEKLHIIKPLYIGKKDIYKGITDTLENGFIYSIEINENTEKELMSTIEYIQKRGYKFVTLNELLKESL